MFLTSRGGTLFSQIAATESLTYLLRLMAETGTITNNEWTVLSDIKDTTFTMNQLWMIGEEVIWVRIGDIIY